MLRHLQCQSLALDRRQQFFQRFFLQQVLAQTAMVVQNPLGNQVFGSQVLLIEQVIPGRSERNEEESEDGSWRKYGKPVTPRTYRTDAHGEVQVKTGV
ncbi:MAG: hypothetical protein R3B84_16220 [Zavarzinella sp.]